MARAINFSGIALENKGDSLGARKMYEQALATYRRIGNKLGVASELDDLGDVLLALGDPVGARQKYEESLAINQEIANPDGVALVKGALGVVLLALGDHETAKKTCDESVELSRQIGDREKAAIGLACLGSASPCSALRRVCHALNIKGKRSAKKQRTSVSQLSP